MRIFKVFSVIIILIILSSCNTSSTPGKNNSQSDAENGIDIEKPMLISSSIDYKESIVADKIHPVVNNGETGISQYKINKLFAEKNHDDKYKIKENNFYDYFLGKNKNAEKLQHFNINLNALPVKEVVTVFSEILGFNYYLDENIKGLVTISINSNLKERTLWEIFEQVLWLSGVYCSLDDGLVHILPFSKMPKERQLLTTFEPKANVSAIMFRLKKSNSSALSKILLPFLTKGAVLIDDSSQNSLLIVDSPSNMPKLASLIKMLDVANRQNYPKIVIKCVNVPPTYIAKELTKILPILGLPLQHINKKGKVELPGAINIQGVDRMQLLVVSAANLEAIDMVENWVKALDTSSYAEQNKLFIYKVQSSRAAKLIAALKVVFNVEGATLSEKNASISSFAGDFSGSDSGGSNSVSNDTGGASSYLVTAFSSDGIGGNVQVPSLDLKKQSSALPVSVFENPIRIFADAVNERLMIRTTDRTYSMLKAVLQKIDTPPVQVLIRVVIADVVLNATTNLGVEVKEWINNSGLKYEINNNVGVYDPKNGNEGFNFLISDWNNPADTKGFLNAVATDGIVKLLAKPEILVENNSQASMFVGDQVPIINQTSQASSDSKDPQSDLMVSQDVTYQEIGLILNVTPSVTQGGLVNVNIDQNISEIDPTNATASAANGLAPSILATRIISTLCLPDNSTIIIGGLIRSDRVDTLNTIPFLGNIPIINRIFGSTAITSKRTELLIMLSVKIVHQTTPQEEMLNRYAAAAKLIEEGLHANVNNDVILNLSGNKTNKIYID